MKVFVTGGTGFVGREVVRHLAGAEHQVVALVRPGSEGKLVDIPNVRMHPGDVTDPNSLSGGVAGCDAVIHLVGIIREYPQRGVIFKRLHVEATRHVLAAAGAAGVKRYLHMSANGVRQNAVSAYHRSKWQAEEAVKASRLDWTILRPSLIFGPGSEFWTMLVDLIRKLPIVPVIGDGKYRMQPVAVGQVAQTSLKALAMPETVGGLFHLGGGESYAYDQILDLIGRALGRKKVVKLHQPLALVSPMVRLLEKFPGFPLTPDQLTMLLEGNVCDQRSWAKVFGIEPISFAEGVDQCFHAGD
jgi:NADH dehydrogenase